jgi:hypothetical protein
VIAGYEDAPLNASERAQVSAVGAEHVQPEPAIETNATPAGRVSVTVTNPLVGAAPAPLLTVRVYLAPVSPGVKAPVCALWMVRTG